MGVSMAMGDPQDGWFILIYSGHFRMDDDWGYPYLWKPRWSSCWPTIQVVKGEIYEWWEETVTNQKCDEVWNSWASPGCLHIFALFVFKQQLDACGLSIASRFERVLLCTGTVRLILEFSPVTSAWLWCFLAYMHSVQELCKNSDV